MTTLLYALELINSSLVTTDWFRFPILFPFLFLVELLTEQVNFLEWHVLDFGPLFVSFTLIDMLQVVIIHLMAYLAV